LGGVRGQGRKQYGSVLGGGGGGTVGTKRKEVGGGRWEYARRNFGTVRTGICGGFSSWED